MAAIVAAGGLTEEASLFVEIRRPARRRTAPSGPSLAAGGVEQASYEVAAAGEATTQIVDLLDAVNQADRGYHLQDGDSVHVGKRPPRTIHVKGLVNSPNEYEIKPNEEVQLSEIIAKAGGKKMQLADKVLVYRQGTDGGPPIPIQCSLREAKNNPAADIMLMPNDVVSVEETVTTVAFETLKTFFRISMGSSLGNLDLFN